MDAPEGESRGAVLSRDTTAEAERIQVEIWRRMSSRERAQVISGACAAARAFAFAGLRARHPEASERKLVALYVELTAGPELARLAYPDLFDPPVPQPSHDLLGVAGLLDAARPRGSASDRLGWSDQLLCGQPAAVRAGLLVRVVVATM